MSKEQKKKWEADDFLQPSGEKVTETVTLPHVEEKSKPLPYTEEETATVYYQISESLRTRLRVCCAWEGQPMRNFITEAIKERLDGKESTLQSSGKEDMQAAEERTASIHYRISKSLRTRLRVYCARRGQSMRNFVIGAITDLLERKEKGTPSA